MLQTSVARVSAATFDSNIIPSSTAAYSLGTTALTWSSINQTIYFSGSNVGIGTTNNPVDTLELNGRLYFDPGSAPASTTNRLYNVSSTLYWNGTAVGGGSWTTTSTGIFYNGGNVGIGTTSPVDKFEVNGAVTFSGYAAAAKASSGYIDWYSTGVRLNSTGPDASHNGTFKITTYRSDFSNGLTPLYIDTGGNIGIGTTGPQGTLNVLHANVDGDTIQRWSYNSDYYLNLKQTITSNVVRWNFSQVNNTTAYDNVLVLDRGNVGIGTTGPGEKLEILNGNVYPNGEGYGIIIDSGGNKRVGFMKYPGLEGAIVHGNSVILRLGQVNQASITGGTFTSQMVIDNSGNVGIGRTPTTYLLEVGGDAGKTAGGTAWESLSDIRLKTVLSDNISGLSMIENLTPIKYKFNDLYKSLFNSSDTKDHYGFSAQEVQKVIPEMVTQDSQGYYWYNPSGFEAILTSAIQEQQGEINKQQGEINNLQSENATLQNQIKTLLAR